MVNFLDILFYCISALFIGANAYNLISSRYVYTLVKDRKVSKIPNHAPVSFKTTIIVPVRDEQKAVNDSIHYFSNWISAAPNYFNVRLIYVSASDRRQDDLGSTCERVQNAITRATAERHHLIEKLTHLHYVGNFVSKAAQVNWAVQSVLLNTSVSPKNHLIGVYDVDARPPTTTFDELLRLQGSLDTPPECIQQLTVYYSAADRTPQVNVFGLLGAMWQTRFSLLVEAFILSRQRFLSCRILHWSIGNGLYIRSDIFSRLGGFSEKHLVEDIEFGFRLSLEDIKIVVMPVFLESGNPNKIVDDVVQKMRWFKGVWEYKFYALDTRHSQKYTLGKWLALQGFIRGFGWLTFGPMIVFLIIYGLFYAEDLLSIILSFSGTLYVWTGFTITAVMVSRIDDAKISHSQMSNLFRLLFVIFISPLYAIAYSLGPIAHLIHRSLLYLAKISSTMRYAITK